MGSISKRIAYLALIGITLGLLMGCRSVYPRTMVPQASSTSTPKPETTRSVEQSQSIWPARWGFESIDPGDRVGVIVDLETPVQELAVAHLSRFHQLRIGDAEYADMHALASSLGQLDPYKFQAEGPGCFLFVPNPPSDGEQQADPEKEPQLAFKFISAQMTDAFAISPSEELMQVLIERTWFTYRSAKEESETIGTVVLMPGMFGTPEPVIDGIERYLNSKGWAVLRMLSHPSRFTQRQQFAVPVGSEAAMSKQIAEMFDTRTAEAAYAASAALRHVHQEFGEHAEKPVALLGMSGGAMILPSVYSFDPDMYDAGVIIAGGGNFLEINTRSNYKKWIDAVDLDADPSDTEIQELEDRQLRELVDLYIKNSKLDSLNTAQKMVGVPMLMLHGSSDKAVPASTGDALYEALGKPERWVYPVGHELIFAGLPLQTPKIERWMREQLIDE
jgi:dienelactone hydrolase